jgi:hypothetical protein
MTKRKAAMIRKAEWKLALAEGRVIRVGLAMTSYPTIEAANTALIAGREAGAERVILQRELTS